MASSEDEPNVPLPKDGTWNDGNTIRPRAKPAANAPTPAAPSATSEITRLGSSSPPAPALPPRSGSNPSQMLPAGEGYELLDIIGRGGFAEVYRARAPGGVVVAIKCMFRPVDDELGKKEVKVLNRIRELRHPFLLQMHNYQVFNRRLIIVMELADGSLHDRFKECAASGLPGIPAEELLHYFTEAAEALDFLRQEKLSHRDIKPQNLLCLKGHAKVADFGLSRTLEQSVEHTKNAGGTPAYMAPEAWGGDISVHSDQYSLAMTWFEMRTGRRPFPGKTMAEISKEHLEGKPDVSGVPEGEQKVLLQALAKKPDQRFPSCVAFVKALKKAIEPEPPVKKPVRGVKAALVLLILGLTGALYVVYSQLGPHSSPPPEASSSPHDPAPPPPEVSWKPPKDWERDSTDVVLDSKEHKYYKRLAREVGGQKVVMVVVPQISPEDPKTFYAMENKVWNDLYAVFMRDPKAHEMMAKYRNRPGCDELASPDPRALFAVSTLGLDPLAAVFDISSGMKIGILPEWCKGGFAPDFNDDPDMAPFFGVKGYIKDRNKGSFPVFRVKVTEAQCFAEWLGGKLPTRRQWFQAAGKDQDNGGRPGPFLGAANNKEELAVGLTDGPRPVDWGKDHVSIHGCRQMAGNGFEWTRDLFDPRGNEEIPLQDMLVQRKVFYVGMSYRYPQPLLYSTMNNDERTLSCTENQSDIGFRVVLER